MPYGDIILQADSTLFRVNRDILAKHSPVFKDMFSLPQSHGQGTMLEGCPIVKVWDSAKDIGILLSDLYNPCQFHDKFCEPFEVVACMLRLGRKYEILPFRDDALSRLHHEFPTKLRLWDRRLANDRLETIKHTWGVYLDLLNLAYENHVYTIIPSLAFKCPEIYTLEQLFEGVDRADGSRVSLQDSTKFTLALALEKIQRWQYASFGSIKGLVCPGDEYVEDNARMFDHIATEGFEDLTLVIHPWHKLFIKDKFTDTDLCESCVERENDAKAEWEARRSKAWKQLPSFFGLPEWKDLKDLD
ncbi:hypothetical protein FB451DRAFT_1175960 [Mycena latifolia]|nr:hypothetical protein FB451DRAFT_1175960 [Mycena latifolia]